MTAMAIAFRWSWIVFFEASAAASTLVLVVGAVIEYKPMLEPIAVLFKKKLTGRITEFERCALRKITRHTGGPILVVLGIAGELIFGLGAFIAQEIESIADESQIARIQNENLTLRGQVGDTAEKLRLANSRFDALEKRAGTIDKQLDAAARSAGNAQHEAKSATASAKRVGELSAEMELLIVAQEEHREFMPLVFNSLSTEGTAKVQIVCIEYECTFARALATSLESFGWETAVIPAGPIGPKGIEISNKWVSSHDNPMRGIFRTPGDEYLQTSERELRRENPDIPESQLHRLSKLGVALRAKLNKDTKLDENSLRIWVGDRNTTPTHTK